MTRDGRILWWAFAAAIVFLGGCGDERDDVPRVFGAYWNFHEEVSVRYCEGLFEPDRSSYTDEEFQVEVDNCAHSTLYIDDGFPRDPRRCYLETIKSTQAFDELVVEIAECDFPLLEEIDRCLADGVRPGLCSDAVQERRIACLPPEFEELHDVALSCTSKPPGS